MAKYYDNPNIYFEENILDEDYSRISARFSRASAKSICRMAGKQGQYIILIEGFIRRGDLFESRWDVSWTSGITSDFLSLDEVELSNNRSYNFIDNCEQYIDCFFIDSLYFSYHH